VAAAQARQATLMALAVEKAVNIQSEYALVMDRVMISSLTDLQQRPIGAPDLDEFLDRLKEEPGNSRTVV
jgi:hypothetical protein